MGFFYSKALRFRYNLLMFKTIFKNYTFSIISLIITTLLSFIATPLILKFLSSNTYGIFQILLQYCGYLGLSSLGLSTAALTFLNDSWTQKDRTHVLRSIKLIFKEYLKTYPVIILIVVMIYFISSSLYIENPELTHEILISFIIVCLPAFISPANIFVNFIKSSESNYIFSILNTAQLILMSLLNIFFAYKGYSLIGLAISYTFTNFLFHLLIIIIALRKIYELPILNLSFEHNRKILWKLSFHSIIQELLGKLAYSTDTVILSFFATPAVVTNFVTNQRLGNLINSIALNVGNSSWASVATLKNDREQFEKIISKINKLLLLITAPLIFSFALNNEVFINLWLGSEYYISDIFTWISFICYTFFGILSFWGWLFLIVGKVHLQTFGFVVSGFINLVLSIIFTKYFGAVGPVLGTLCAFYLFYFWFMIYLIKKHLKISVWGFVKDLHIVIFLLAILYFLPLPHKIFSQSSWLNLVINLAYSYIPSLMITILGIYKYSEIRSFYQLFKSRFNGIG